MMFVLVAGLIFAMLSSVLFAGADYTLGSISRDSIDKMAENGVPGAQRLARLTGDRRRFELMLLAGRVSSIAAGTLLFAFILIRLYISLGSGWQTLIGLAFLVPVFVFVLTDGVFSRLVATGELESNVSRFTLFLTLSAVLLYPFSVLLDGIAGLFIKPTVELAAKEEALREYVKSESELGVIEEEEGEMIQSILAFADTTVREVMVPRIDVVAADIAMPVNDLISLFKSAGHSRIPMYDGRIDNIVGVLYAKDLLIEVAEKGKKATSAASIMRKPYYVPETKKISELLNDLRQAKLHLAIVVDEYGGTSGIVALEDLIEEIVGDIQDEYDSEERTHTWLDPHTVLLDAGLNVEEVNDILRTDIPNEDFDTLAGFLYHQLGYIPTGGEEMEWGGLTFSIKEINGHRISKVLVTLGDDGGKANEPEA